MLDLKYLQLILIKLVQKHLKIIYLVKCFFYFVKCIWKYLKKYGLTEKDNIKESVELSYNIKMLCFVHPDNIYSIYIKIEKKYNQSKYVDFSIISTGLGSQKVKK